MRRLPRRALRGSALMAAVVAAVLVDASPAWAHVTAHTTDIAAQGGTAVITFRVPDESDTAGTTKLEVTVPTEYAITSVRTTPVTGWTATLTRTTLNPPAQVNGNAVAEVISAITWTANPGAGIRPNEYLDFPASIGPLPTGRTVIVLPATQTYDDGQLVAWSDPPAGVGEPEHPAPTVALVPAPPGQAAAGADGDAAATPAGSTASTAAPAPDGTTRWMAGIALLLGALSLGVAVGTMLRSRRATPTTGTRAD